MSEEKQKKTKKPSNFALEQFGEVSAEGFKVWLEIAEGFVSPEKALDYAEKEKVRGEVRVVRIVTPSYQGSVTVPEPVYTLKKVGVEKAPRKSKKAALEVGGAVGPAPEPPPPPMEAIPKE
jgi:hypothetical protein